MPKTKKVHGSGPNKVCCINKCEILDIKRLFILIILIILPFTVRMIFCLMWPTEYLLKCYSAFVSTPIRPDIDPRRRWPLYQRPSTILIGIIIMRDISNIKYPFDSYNNHDRYIEDRYPFDKKGNNHEFS